MVGRRAHRKVEPDDAIDTKRVEIRPLGSSVLSNIIIIDRERYRIADIVSAAFANSAVSLSQWNKFRLEDRDEIITAQISLMRKRLELGERVTWYKLLISEIKNAALAEMLKTHYLAGDRTEAPLPRPI
jgi:hypothetical protein